MRIRTSIYLLLWITIYNLTVYSKKILNTKDIDDDDDDSVTVEASHPITSKSSRKSRHVAYVRGSWLDALGEGNPCLASNGVLGACIPFRKCYPFIREQDSILTYNSWYIGNYDPCSFFSSNGRQNFGICCTNQPADNSHEISNQIDNNLDDNKKVTSSQQWPPPLPTHPPHITRATTRSPTRSPFQWPPPIPTHPPNHAAPTHPPSHNDQRTTTKQPWWTSPSTTPTTTTRSTTTTQNPWWTPSTTTPNPWWPPSTPSTTTTTTQKPWWTPPPTTTTQRPITPQPIWPPPIPTHPPHPTHPPSHYPDESIENEHESDNFQGHCGTKNGARDQERIVGGQNASPNEWPWVVVLFNNGRQFCGGSLIDKIHILTAAHCVAQMSSWDVARVTAHLGDHDIRNPHEVRHTIRRIKRVVRHKGFEFSTLHNDVAVLTLDEPVTYSRTISPVCLPTSSTTGKSYRGLLATVAGWGSLRENGPQPSVLQKVTIPVWSNDDCARKYGGAAPAGIIPSMICAGQIAKDSCSGDSGGPLMLQDGAAWTQVGIVSWGIGCGKGQYPGVYTRVSAFMPWITKNLHLK